METIRRRGKGKKQALIHIGVRVPAYVDEYFRQNHAAPTIAIRAVLEQHVKQQLTEVTPQ